MRSPRYLLLAVPAVAMLLAAPAAHADWYRHGNWGHRGHDNTGAIVAGALLGLGAAAVIGSALAAPPPAYAYAPPPVAYAPPPAYYAPPGYYAPPPAYAAPAPYGYYGQ
jgi:hypothetical protein